METIVPFDTIEYAVIENVNKARQRMLDLVTEDMKEPTWDGERYHAPCDNYLFDGRSYAGGQYLHDPDVNGSSTARAKVMVDSSVVDRMIELMKNNGARASAGKTWTIGSSSRCYLYVDGPGRVVNVLTRLVPSGGKTLVMAKAGVETGRTWVTTLGKLKSKICPYTMEPYESVEDALLSLLYGWMCSDKKKTVSVEVGYQYRNYLIG